MAANSSVLEDATVLKGAACTISVQHSWL